MLQKWSGWVVMIHRPLVPETSALPTELRPDGRETRSRTETTCSQGMDANRYTISRKKQKAGTFRPGLGKPTHPIRAYGSSRAT